MSADRRGRAHANLGRRMSHLDRKLRSGRRAALHPKLTDGSPALGASLDVWILQRHRTPKQAFESENTARLAEALSVRGISSRPVNPDMVDQTGGPRRLRVQRRSTTTPAALIGRSGSNMGAEASALSAMLEAAGSVAFPTERALALAGDKIKAGQLLTRAGLPVPDFVQIGPGVDGHALGAALGWPLVVKAARGSKGRAVRLFDGPDALAAAVTELSRHGPLIAQRFVAESRGRDIRVIVIGGIAIGAMAREASSATASCANIATGGRGRPIILSSELEQLVEAAAQTTELEIAGIDLLHAGKGYALCEVNTAPGFVAFEAAAGINVAAAIAAHVAARLGNDRRTKPC